MLVHDAASPEICVVEVDDNPRNGGRQFEHISFFLYITEKSHWNENNTQRNYMNE